MITTFNAEKCTYLYVYKPFVSQSVYSKVFVIIIAIIIIIISVIFSNVIFIEFSTTCATKITSKVPKMRAYFNIFSGHDITKYYNNVTEL